MPEKRKIAVLIDWYLPGTKAGGPVRSVHSLITLLKDEFDFYVLTTNCDLGSMEAYADIPADQLFRREGVNYCYFEKGSISTRKIISMLQEIRPGLVYLNSFWSWQFSIAILRAKKKAMLPCPVVLAPRGMLSRGAMGLKRIKKKVFLAFSKRAGLHKNIAFHATNDQERGEILSLFPGAEVHVAPNLNAIGSRTVKKSKRENELKLFYLSRIARVKNLHFALEILKEVAASVSVSYDIFGNIEDEVYWKHCQQLIAALPPNIRVRYSGELPFDRIQDTIQEYHALLMPTRNENFGHSIVESLSSGCAVIISDQTPWTDVNAAAAGFALPLDKTQAYVRAVEALAAFTEAEMDQLSERSNKYISNKLNSADTLSVYRKLFNGTAKD